MLQEDKIKKSEIEHIDRKLKTVDNYIKTTDINTSFYDVCMVAKDALIELRHIKSRRGINS